jgi:hypothetical protein
MQNPWLLAFGVAAAHVQRGAGLCPGEGRGQGSHCRVVLGDHRWHNLEFVFCVALEAAVPGGCRDGLSSPACCRICASLISIHTLPLFTD